MNQELPISLADIFSPSVPSWVVPQAVPARVNAPERDFSDGVQYLLVDRQINFITKEDYYQMKRYLVSCNKDLGIIVNFREYYLKPKRVLNRTNRVFVDLNINSDLFG